MIEIRQRHTGRALLALETLRGANLQKADLRGADLAGQDLSEANLSMADLSGADLSDANLSGAILTGAYLRGAYLKNANLKGARLNWFSHALVSEILFRAAGAHAERRALAGLVNMSQDWCWPEFLALKHSQTDWALSELAKHVPEKYRDDAPKEIGGALSVAPPKEKKPA